MPCPFTGQKICDRVRRCRLVEAQQDIVMAIEDRDWRRHE
jgi:hypothetical protein